jgi:hypothetical protein
MKFSRIFLLAAAFVLCGASTALAGPKYIVTAPALKSVGAAQTLHCDITNLDDEPQDVRIEGMNYAGAVVDGPYDTTIQPGQADYLQTFATDTAWCRFTVNTSVKKFRGIAIYDKFDYGYTITIAGQ